jgi:hypothetical protein
LITKQPYIFNNGYKIRFNEIPLPRTRIEYIVPEWIDEETSIEDLQEVFGCELPNIVMTLPLQPEKVDVIQVDIGGHPPIPTGSKQSSGNLLFLAVFRFLNFWGHFEPK